MYSWVIFCFKRYQGTDFCKLSFSRLCKTIFYSTIFYSQTIFYSDFNLQTICYLLLIIYRLLKRALILVVDCRFLNVVNDLLLKLSFTFKLSLALFFTDKLSTIFYLRCRLSFPQRCKRSFTHTIVYLQIIVYLYFLFCYFVLSKLFTIFYL